MNLEIISTIAAVIVVFSAIFKFADKVIGEDDIRHIHTKHMYKGDDKEFSKAILEKVLDIVIIEE